VRKTPYRGTAPSAPGGPVVAEDEDTHPLTVEQKEPLPQTVGPYRILGVLGQGGMGVVYRGVRVDTSEPAAVKTVLARSSSMLSSIRREIHALSLLRHPGVVRIVDKGVFGGLPWYAMELLEGRTMRSYLKALWKTRTITAISSDVPTVTGANIIVDLAVARPPSEDPTPALPVRPAWDAESLGPTLSLWRRLCEPLAYLHGEGIVHLDLKPENIFIENDGEPVLVDLGIASQFRGEDGREAVELRPGLAGTCPYMAPEQITAGLVDARADLYSLGCILYECLVGSPPFSGDVATILRDHLSRVPPPPSSLAAGIPEALSELVMKLLEKRPADRFGYASDVAAALERAGAPLPPGPVLPRPNVYLYRPTLVGRQEPMRKVHGAVADASEGQGRLLFIGGESGTGKTRLAMEGVREAASRGMLVIAGQCVALGADARQMRAAPLHPLRPFLTALLDRCRELGTAATARLLGTCGPSLAAFEPALAELPGQSQLEEPPPLEPRAARARLLTHLQAALFALAEEAPLFLLLDDLQWADDLSLSFLGELAARDLSGRRLLIAGTYRMEERSEELERLIRSKAATSIELGRLDEGGVAEMVGDMLALPSGPPELVRFLVRRSGGNPLFVAEHLRAAVEHGMLTRDAAGRWRLELSEGPDSFDSRVPLPRSLAALLEGRLALLPREDLALAEIAAVLGDELQPRLLELASGLAEPTVLEGLERLRVRQILEDARGRLRFTHDKLRTAIQASIPALRLRALHRAAASAIEAVHGAVPDLWPALSHHYVEAGVHERAAELLALAGERARAAAALGEAAAYFREAIKQAEAAGAADDAPQIIDLYERLGDVLALAGKQSEAREAFLAACRVVRAECRIDGARLRRKLGKTYETAHAHAEALAAYAEAEAWLGAAPPAGADPVAFRREWISIRTAILLAHYWTGRVDAMEHRIEEVRLEIEQGGPALERALFFDALLHIALRRERFLPSDETVEYAKKALEAAVASGDAATEGWARFMFVFTLLFRGALADAEAQTRRGIAQAERAGDVILLARYHTYLVLVLRRSGRVDEVRHATERALSLASGAGMLDYVAVARANQAWVAVREGRRDEAFRLTAEARSDWAALAVTYPFQWTALFPALCTALERGDLACAAELSTAMLAEHQARLPDEIARPLSDGSRAVRSGDTTRAHACLEEALAVARRHGFA